MDESTKMLIDDPDRPLIFRFFVYKKNPKLLITSHKEAATSNTFFPSYSGLTLL